MTIQTQFLWGTLLLCASTITSNDIRAATNELPERCGFVTTQQAFQQLRDATGSSISATRPSLPEFAELRDGHFRIHYTRTGIDAVPPADVDGSGVPDFVEVGLNVLEAAWHAYVDDMGYGIPPSDGEAGGSKAIDVYLHDLSKAGSSGTGLYGNTEPEQRVSSGPPERYTAWMEMDNDFSPDDRNLNGNPVFATHGTDGLKVTSVHELHHVFQVGSYGVLMVQLMIYEFTSTWMEQRFYPEIPDWVTYSSNLFTLPAGYPLSSSTGSNGYVWGFFNQALHHAGGDALLRKAWERIGTNEQPFSALVHACNDVGTSLRTTFSQNLPMFYHTGSRDRSDDLLRFGDKLPEIVLSADQPAKPPTELVSGSLRAFELRAFRYSVPSATGAENVSTAIMLTWPDEDAFVRANANEQHAFTVTVTSSPLPTDVPIQGTNWAVRVEPADMYAWIDGSVDQRIQAPYPQPVRLGISRDVFVPVPQAQYAQTVEITVFTLEHEAKQQLTTTVILDDNRLAAPLHLAENITPGVYLVQCTYNDHTWLTKLMVQR